MPGPNSKFTLKGDRQAQHVAEGYEKKGMSPKEAESIGYAVASKAGNRKKKKIASRKRRWMA